jgi:peptide/nickel transport system permease protein
MGPGLTNAMIAVGVSVMPVYARTARGNILSVKTNEYIEAARAIGAPDWRLMLRHILPNIMAPIIVVATVNVGTAILAAAGLSYLGLGAQPPSPEWGAMLSVARNYLRDAWWMATFPGLSIMVIVLAVNLLGDGLRDVLDPSLKNK